MGRGQAGSEAVDALVGGRDAPASEPVQPVI